MFGTSSESVLNRPSTPPLEGEKLSQPTQPLPPRGPLRERYYRERDLAKERERLSRMSSQSQSGQVPACNGQSHSTASCTVNTKPHVSMASGLGFGPCHPAYYAYTRSAQLKGVYHSDGRFCSESKQPRKAEGTPIRKPTNSTLLQTPDQSWSSQDFVAAKKHYSDPISLAAPQALGLVKRMKRLQIPFYRDPF